MNTQFTEASGRRAPRTLWLTVVTPALLALLAAGAVYAMLELMSGGRAYVYGEGRWSKGQQTAVFNLDRYAETGQPRYLRAAREALDVPLGDREARLALSGDAYDYQRAYDGMLRGGHHPSDIPTMIWMLEHFENAPYFRRAIGTWAEADNDILRLASLAGRLEREWASSSPNRAEVARLRQELMRIDRRLRPLENRFSQALGEGLRTLKLVFVVLSAVLFLASAVAVMMIFRWAIRHISASERMFWATIEHAPVGVALVRGDGRFVHVNDTLCGTLGYGREEIMDLSVADILVPSADSRPAGLLRRAADAGDAGVTVETRCLKRNGDALWCKLNLARFPDHHSAKGRGADEFIATLEDISESRRLSEELSYQAAHDPLTGLLNRRRFEADLSEALEQARLRALEHTLGFIDLNDFKRVNDTAGHLAGDRLLEAVAGAMRSCLRSADSLARVGGDEFGFILYGCDIQQGRETAEKLRRAVESVAVEWQGRRLSTSISVGLVVLSADTPDPEAALQAADRACYMAKSDSGVGMRSTQPAVRAGSA